MGTVSTWAAGDRTHSISPNASVQAEAGLVTHQLGPVVSSGTGSGVQGAGPVAESSGFWVRSSTWNASPRASHSDLVTAAAAAGASGGGGGGSSSPRVARWMPPAAPPFRWTYSGVPAAGTSAPGAAPDVRTCVWVNWKCLRWWLGSRRGAAASCAAPQGPHEGAVASAPTAPAPKYIPTAVRAALYRILLRPCTVYSCGPVPYTPAAVSGRYSKPCGTWTGFGKVHVGQAAASFLPSPSRAMTHSSGVSRAGAADTGNPPGLRPRRTLTGLEDFGREEGLTPCFPPPPRTTYSGVGETPGRTSSSSTPSPAPSDSQCAGGH